MAQPPRIVIFAKIPVAGLVKTRLIPALGAQGAARLAAALLDHTVAQALSSGVGPVELCVTPGPHDPVWSRLAPQATLNWSDQGDGDLGARMARAAQRALSAGEPVLLMGTDCPELTAGRIQTAAASLTAADAVLVPAFDGGYVLLGLNRFDASLFAGIAWSTATVAQETRRRVEQLGWSLQTLPTLHDIDEPADLRWLPAHLQPAI